MLSEGQNKKLKLEKIKETSETILKTHLEWNDPRRNFYFTHFGTSGPSFCWVRLLKIGFLWMQDKLWRIHLICTPWLPPTAVPSNQTYTLSFFSLSTLFTYVFRVTLGFLTNFMRYLKFVALTCHNRPKVFKSHDNYYQKRKGSSNPSY